MTGEKKEYTQHHIPNTRGSEKMKTAEDGSSPYASDVEAAVAKATEGLKRNMNEAIGEKKREQEKRRAAEEKLKLYEGIDLDAYHAAQEKLASVEDLDIDAARGALAAQTDYTAKEAQLTKDYNGEVTRRDTRISRLTAKLAQTVVTSELNLALTKKSDTPGVIVPYAEKFTRARETANGEWQTYHVDGTGAERKDFTMDQFVAQLSDQFPEAFRGTGSSGGGSQRSTPSYGSRRTIAAGDNKSFINNLDAIIDGDVDVR